MALVREANRGLPERGYAIIVYGGFARLRSRSVPVYPVLHALANDRRA